MILLGGGVAVAAAYLGSPPAAEPAGGNHPVNAGAVDPRDISAHNSPTLARNPADEGNLAIANRIDTPRYSCALHVSFDGGSSWAQTPIPVPAGEEPKCYAPDVAFGADGTMYLSYVTLAGRGNTPHAAWVATSEDGGATLADPLPALGPLAFQVRLVADPAVAGRLFLTWLQAEEVGLFRFAESGNPISFARSDDGGETWQGPVTVGSAERERVVAPALAAGPRGELYVAYLDLEEDRLDYEGAHEGRGGPPYPGGWKLVVARSLDGGATWTEAVVDELVPAERMIVFVPPYPSLAVDAASGAVYVSFFDSRLGDPDVWLWSSRDGARTFSEATRVNDTAAGDGSTQRLPKVAVAPGGRVDVVYYDRRDDAGDVMTEVSLQSSFDAGRSFGERVRISERSFDSGIGFGAERGLPDLGSRLGLISTDALSLAVWTDTRAGTEASNKQDLVRAVVAFAERPYLASPWSEYLFYAGIGAALAGAGLFVHGLRRRRKMPPVVTRP